MRTIVLTRIDERLIHGQIATQWLKIKSNPNYILIVDEKLPNDMPLLLELIGKRAAEENGKPVDLSKIDVNGLIHTGAEGICDLAEKLK